MRDLTNLYRQTVGFDRLFSLMDNLGLETAPSYPPYNIEKMGEDDYRITMAVAGFTEEDIHIEVKEQNLTIRAAKTAREQDNSELIYQGIAARSFERRFHLADHVQVTGAKLENGLLHIDLKREIPEEKKPRTIAINSGDGKIKRATLENRAA
jgi:molecular chaperone IbpA